MSQLKKGNSGGSMPRANVSDVFEAPEPAPEPKEKIGNALTLQSAGNATFQVLFYGLL